MSKEIANPAEHNFEEVRRYLDENLKLSADDQLSVLEVITDCLDKLVPLSGSCDKLSVTKMICGIPIIINLLNHKLTIVFPGAEPFLIEHTENMTRNIMKTETLVYSEKKESVKITPELTEKIKNYLNYGYSQREVETLTGVSRHIISNIVRGKDVINEKHKRTAGVITPELIEEIKTLFGTGCTKTCLEETTGVSRYYINKILKGEQVPTDGKIKRHQKTMSVQKNSSAGDTWPATIKCQ